MEMRKEDVAGVATAKVPRKRTCLLMGACSEITFVLILDRPVPCGEFNLIEGGDYWNFT